MIQHLINKFKGLKRLQKAKTIYMKFKNYTMIPKGIYVENLLLGNKFLRTKGKYVECGVWKGGMSAGFAEMFGNDYEYHLFDSFEGLPPAKEIDGKEAIEWQIDTKSSNYYDNCKADERYAIEAMKKAGVDRYFIYKGWFDNTFPTVTIEDISILRIDSDWYDSVIVCLEKFYPSIIDGGIVIIDDYYTWDGCSKAVHDYLSRVSSSSRVYMFNNSVTYIVKKN